LSFDTKKFRLRVGQSKVPFGFENLQSSQNRLTLDRNDALNVLQMKEILVRSSTGRLVK
jgi:phosphate-selective porin